MESNKKIYFASDFHLGVDALHTSKEREQRIIKWLDWASKDAAAIYLVGDVFDFWFEYKTVIPKGYIRLFGKLAALRDQGVPIYFFTGNHDMWMFAYLEKELGIPTYREPIKRTFAGKTFFIGHGDGLGPGDHGYKFLKKVFANRFCQWLFERLHPNFGISLAEFWSGTSRGVNPAETTFLGPEKEWLVQFSNDYIEKDPIDYFIFGHRHLPIHHLLNNGKSRYINLGEWLHYYSYAVFDGNTVQLNFFENESGRIFGNQSEMVDSNS